MATLSTVEYSKTPQYCFKPPYLHHKNLLQTPEFKIRVCDTMTHITHLQIHKSAYHHTWRKNRSIFPNHAISSFRASHRSRDFAIRSGTSKHAFTISRQYQHIKQCSFETRMQREPIVNVFPTILMSIAKIVAVII